MDLRADFRGGGAWEAKESRKAGFPEAAYRKNERDLPGQDHSRKEIARRGERRKEREGAISTSLPCHEKPTSGESESGSQVLNLSVDG